MFLPSQPVFGDVNIDSSDDEAPAEVELLPDAIVALNVDGIDQALIDAQPLPDAIVALNVDGIDQQALIDAQRNTIVALRAKVKNLQKVMTESLPQVLHEITIFQHMRSAQTRSPCKCREQSLMHFMPMW